MTTVNDLMVLALKDAAVLGVGQTALAEDINETLFRTNMMLAQWQRTRWLVWHLIDLKVVSTGAESYSIGPAVGVQGAVYNSGSGLVTLTLVGQINLPVGQNINIQEVGGTGSFAELNGSFPAGPGTSGQILTYQITPGLTLTASGGQFVPDILTPVRPDRLESGFFRQLINSSVPNQIDYSLEILESREDYNRIALKQLSSFAMYVFYDSAYPLGYIYAWPVPEANIYEVHVSVKEILNSFTGLTEEIMIPAEYQAAIVYNLIQRLRVAYRLPPDQMINGLAKDALNTLRKANAQIPRLQMPRMLVRPAGYYNIYSDQIR